MLQDIFGTKQYERNIGVPLKIHSVYWVIGLILLAVIIVLAEQNVFDRLGIFVSLFYVILLSLVSMLITSVLISNTQINLAKDLHVKRKTRDDRGPLAKLFEDVSFAWSLSIFSSIERLWKVHTEDVVKHIVRAHVRLYGKSVKEAQDDVQNKLAYWLYVTGTDIGMPNILKVLNIFMYFVVFAVALSTWFYWQNSGMVVLTIIMSLIATRTIYHTRLQFYYGVHSALLVTSMRPVFYNEGSTQPIYVYDGLAQTPGERIKLFEKPVEWLNFNELSRYMVRLYESNVDVVTTKQVSQDVDERVRNYITRHIEEGYPIDTLRKALIDAGNDSNSVDSWIAQATGTPAEQGL